MRFAPLFLFALSALAQQGPLTFDKISKYDRPAEPVSFGMPFPAGVLRAESQLTLLDGARPLPTQTRVTSRWPDGTIRWALVRALVDLPGNQPKQITWAIRANAPAPPIEWTRQPDGSLHISTGPPHRHHPRQRLLPPR